MRENSVGLISVIVPVYNERRYLKACIDSVLNQTYPDFELILVDDGSDNGAQDDCDMFAKTDSRIKVVHKKNEGLSAARITGIKNSTGDWLMFMDHDDLISHNILEILTKQIDDSTDIVASRRFDTETPESYKWDESQNIEVWKDNGRNIVEAIPDDRQQLVITIPLWGKLYRRSFLDSINLEEYRDVCPTIFFEDVLMTPIIYSKAKTICIVKRILYLHREVSTSISRSGKLSSFYFDQIYSGDILLKYAKCNGLSRYYCFYIGAYIQSILRIYGLMDEYVTLADYNNYKHLIAEKEKKYRKDFFTSREVPLLLKISCFIYVICPSLFVKLLRTRVKLKNCKK